ncbi:MAG: hypothetical protein PHR96_01885 [Clostridia bacterium]|nr:hypothetical protein [Clostridia bacterium]
MKQVDIEKITENLKQKLSDNINIASWVYSWSPVVTIWGSLANENKYADTLLFSIEVDPEQHIIKSTINKCNCKNTKPLEKTFQNVFDEIIDKGSLCVYNENINAKDFAFMFWCDKNLIAENFLENLVERKPDSYLYNIRYNERFGNEKLMQLCLHSGIKIVDFEKYYLEPQSTASPEPER